MTIRAIRPEDIAQVATIHKARSSAYLLGQYSTALIGRYYEGFVGRSVFLVDETAGRIDGFVLGGEATGLATCRGEFSRSNRPALVRETLLRPKVWLIMLKRAGKAMLCRKKTAPSKAVVSLLSIVVAEHAGKKGVGAALVRAFEAAIGDKYSAYRLSVAKDNQAAIRFYRKLGLEIEGETNESFVMTKRLGSEPVD